MKQQEDEIDKLLYEYFHSNKGIPEKTAEVIKNAPHKKHFNYQIGKYVAAMVILLFLTTGVVFAKDIIKFIDDIFNLTSINIQNDSIVDAIENKNYIQNIEMDYVPLNDNYNIKIDYLMLDDINLYVVFNIYSNKNIDLDTRFSIWDLVITDNNGVCLYDGSGEVQENKIISSPGWKNIDTNNEKIRELFFLMTTGIGNIESLNIKFSRLALYDRNNPSADDEIRCNCNFNIDISDKFINREVIEYKEVTNISISDEYKIERCIVTDTGLYLVYKTNNPSLSFEFLNATNITSNLNLLGNTDKNDYIILQQFNITKDTLQKIEKIKFNDSIKTITLKRAN